MGWSFRRGATKQQVIDEILKPRDFTATEESAKAWYGAQPAGTRTQSVVLAHRCVGNSLWYVRETTTTAPDGTVKAEKWIGLSLLDTDGSYGWGHKDMDEAMMPYETSCPVEFLDMAPMPETQWGTEWRDAVRANGTTQMGLFAVTA